MARTAADLPPGTRLTDYISVGVLAKTFPPARVHAILAATGKASVRQRELPAPVTKCVTLLTTSHEEKRQQNHGQRGT